MQQRPHIAPEYDEDFFAWTQHQARVLRLLEKLHPEIPDDLDLAQFSEEIEDLGKVELRGATSRIGNIMVHLIKSASEPSADAMGHWRTETTTFHVELPDFYVRSMRWRIDLQKQIGSDVPIKCPFIC